MSKRLNRFPTGLKDSPELKRLMEAAVGHVEAMSPEEKEAMFKAQRESWAKQDMD